MKMLPKKALAIILALAMMLSLLVGCGSDTSNQDSTSGTADDGAVTEPAEADGTEVADGNAEAGDVSAEYNGEHTTPEELGSGDVKWSEETTADGWILVTNEGGETLGYSPDSGISLIQVDGYAFKDLDRDELLDIYEDWRLDDQTRAADLAAHMAPEEMTPLLMQPIWDSFGTTLTEEDQTFLEDGGRAGLTRSASSEGNTGMAVKWNNLLQVFAEANGGYGIPVTISSDPSNISGIIDQNALAATMDTEMAFEIGQEMAKEYRAIGVTMFLGPQVDLASTPSWRRAKATYSEDPALNRDLANAFISGLQSTYSEDGTDLGWGNESVVSIVKHYVGAGASEGGRNDHYAYGMYTVFPGGNFEAHLIPFFDGAFHLDSVTSYAGGVMPNYAISYSEDGSLGDLVGGAFSSYKIGLLRDNGYDGFIVTDWYVTNEGGTGHGLEDKTPAERFCLLLENGVDQAGGAYATDTQAAYDGYLLLVEDWGEADALARLRNAVTHFFVTQFEVGLYENPYISTEYAKSIVWSDESKEFAAETQEQAVVMLKNSDNTIHAYDETAETPTLYVPYTVVSTFNPSTNQFTVTCDPAIDLELASQYYNIVTDTVGEPSGEDGTYVNEDITRATAAEVAACDYAIVSMRAPFTEGKTDADGNYLPASLTYAPYTADSDAVRKEALANGTIVMEFSDGYYGTSTQEIEEDRSYYGNSVGEANTYVDYETLLYVADVVPDSCKIIVSMEMSENTAMVWTEVEPLADAIFVYYAREAMGTYGRVTLMSNESLLRFMTGQVEPSALLPIQQPADMDAVESQLEDVPRDTECYVDADGNTYDFAFGLNWSGVINDERVATYSAPALTAVENWQIGN